MFNIDMNTVAKVAVGVGAAIVGLFVAKKVVKKKKKVYINARTAEVVGNDEDCVDERTPEELQAEAAEKVSGALNWVTDHEKEFKGFCTVLGAAGAVVSLVNGIRQFGVKNKILKNLEELNKMKDTMYKVGYNESLAVTEQCLRDALADKDHPFFDILDKNGNLKLQVKVEAA